MIWAAALGAPLVVAALLALVRDGVPGIDATLVLVLVVVGVAATGSRSAGVAAALSSAVWFDFFLTVPYVSFTIDDREDLETAVLLALVSLAVTEVALWGRRQQARWSRNEGYLDGVVAAAGMAARGDTDADAVVAFVAQQVHEVLAVDDCAFRPGPPSGLPRLESDGSVTVHGRPVDVARDGLPFDDVVELPVVSGGTTYGCYRLTASTALVRPSVAQRRVAVALAGQAGAALASSGKAAA